MSRPAARKTAPKGEYIETVGKQSGHSFSMIRTSPQSDYASSASFNIFIALKTCRVFSSLDALSPFSAYHCPLLSASSKKNTSRSQEPCLISLQDSGNKVSRRAAITGTANITLGGRTVIMADVQLRGDLHPTRSAPSQSGRETTPISINIGRCTVISTGSVIKPPARISRGQVHYYPMKIGDNVFVGKCPNCICVSGNEADLRSGPNSTISAISISSHVHIGANVTIQPFAIIKENVKILPHTVVPTNMVIASGSVVGGQPARVIGEVGEGWGVGGGGAGGGLGVGGGGEEKWVEGGDLRELVRSIK